MSGSSPYGMEIGGGEMSSRNSVEYIIAPRIAYGIKGFLMEFDRKCHIYKVLILKGKVRLLHRGGIK